MSSSQHQSGISRRTFMKTSTLSGLAIAAQTLPLPFGMRRAAAAVSNALTAGEDKIV